uniref:Uncharacterized protein n=1 Tax=Panagrolaimus superbus TaxID=310955 RepID=A0A914YHS3_9BILA
MVEHSVNNRDNNQYNNRGRGRGNYRGQNSSYQERGSGNNSRQPGNRYEQLSYNESTDYVGYIGNTGQSTYGMPIQPRAPLLSYPAAPQPPSFSDMAFGMPARPLPPQGQQQHYNNRGGRGRGGYFSNRGGDGYNGDRRGRGHDQRHRPYDNRHQSHYHNRGSNNEGRGGGQYDNARR